MEWPRGVPNPLCNTPLSGAPRRFCRKPVSPAFCRCSLFVDSLLFQGETHDCTSQLSYAAVRPCGFSNRIFRVPTPSPVRKGSMGRGVRILATGSGQSGALARFERLKGARRCTPSTVHLTHLLKVRQVYVGNRIDSKPTGAIRRHPWLILFDPSKRSFRAKVSSDRPLLEPFNIT